MKTIFDLSGKVALITGGAGLLGKKHAEAIIECGATVIIADVDQHSARKTVNQLNECYGKQSATILVMDVTCPLSVQKAFDSIAKLDILINNAAKDPKVKKENGLTPQTRFETMEHQYWREGIDVSLDGTFLCCQAAAKKMNQNGGVILNIASDLSIISPDQRIYAKEGLPDHLQHVKPITYSAAKWAVVGMTKYLSTYLANKNIRVNALSPGGVYNDHPEDFVNRLTNLIPMKRMASIDEYKGAVAFMCSDASSYMTGTNMVIDGGRSVW